MTTIAKISCILIGISFSLRLHTPLAYGASIAISLIFILIEEKKKNFSIFKFINKNPIIPYFSLTLLSFSISSILSTLPLRSFLVTVYFFSFFLISYLFFSFFKKKDDRLLLTLNFLIISIFFSVSLVFFYNISNFKTIYLVNNEIRKYKGFVNLLTILVFLCPFFENVAKNQKPYLSFVMLILVFPVIFLSNCNSALLGIIGGFVWLSIFWFINNSRNKKKVAFTFVIVTFLAIISLFNSLSYKVEKVTKNNENFLISTNILDAHRQIIWGFSFLEFKKKPFFGVGADTSNFLNNSQDIIDHALTGDMTYIPSHPHNFFLELLLETGIFGLLNFLLLVFFTNYFLVKKLNFYCKSYIIFFNGYFWSASMVNFSFWAAWWQGSYFLILTLLYSVSKYQMRKLNVD